MSVRSYSLSDILRHQRLARYATRLDPEYHLLLSHTPFRAALAILLPWLLPGVTTYTLVQQRNGLAHSGFLELFVPSSDSRARVLTLMPALDAPAGHPAAWQKLIVHGAQELAQRGITRLLAQVPDQPLPVQTFKQVGFQLYTHQTVWRRVHSAPPRPVPPDALRPAAPEDTWALARLLRRITPPAVWEAEQAVEALEGSAQAFGLERLGSPFHRVHSEIHVLARQAEIRAALRVDRGPRGVWLHLWVDPLDRDPSDAHLVLGYGLVQARSSRPGRPVYIGLREDQQGLRSLLHGYGFVPFTDRACMVRPLVQRVERRARRLLADLVAEALPGTLAIPQSRRLHWQETWESAQATVEPLA